MYKVFIPSAGLGKRLGDSYKNLNKALVSLNNKPVISHLIEKFNKEIEIVVAIGHRSKLLNDYLNIAHHDRKITCIDIENYFGEGSGLGLTILQCKNHLQCPFIFCPNDTFVLEDIPEPSNNWVGCSKKLTNNLYRSIKLKKNNTVDSILEKDQNNEVNLKSYIGLSGIKNYINFWKEMETGRNYGSIKIGESYGIQKLINLEIPFEVKDFTWYDTGNIKSLEKAKLKLKQKEGPEILEKRNEAIWFVNGKAIKYNNDINFISERIERAEFLKGFVPKIIDKTDHLYSYKMITGQTLSKVSNKKIFSKLLEFLDNFWERKLLTSKEENIFKESCNKFYKDKTYKRVELYLSRFSDQDTKEWVNGEKIETIQELLHRVNWQLLKDGISSRIHGDLHFENILMAETGDFCLLDWRQNFGGIKAYGDLYYDLAKLNHGLIISHELINKEYYFINKEDDIIKFDFYRKNTLVEIQDQFYKYLEKNHLDLNKVKLLTYLIFINISSLHHEPYAKLLFYLGKKGLSNILNSDSRLNSNNNITNKKSINF